MTSIPNKSWMKLSRLDPAYGTGVNLFLDFALANNNRSDGVIQCPCKRCSNRYPKTPREVREHLIMYGFMPNYNTWIYHGESPSVFVFEATTNRIGENNSMQEMLTDALGMDPMNVADHEETTMENQPTEDAIKFYRLMKDAEQELYPGCKQKYTKLYYIVRLFQLKSMGGWNVKSFTGLLELLKDSLPEGECLPNSYYECKKFISDLGLHYNKIDACQNDCMLFWKDSANKEVCDTCGFSRWKQIKENSVIGLTPKKKKVKKILAKILRHFPLKPRLQRLYMSSKTASLMKWHCEERVDDGLLRHPADSDSWKILDTIEDFGKEKRNVRLGLATDGFNPNGNMSIAHSTWPVILIPYNLPPLLCMKQPNFIMSLLIPGPSSPGNNIDVYLEPLIDELRDLWVNGVKTFDASTKQVFNMRAGVLWTIHDLPAYGSVCGWSIQGKMACPCCQKDTWSLRLPVSPKQCYMGHRRFLNPDHDFRWNKKSFDNKTEFGLAPKRLSGFEVLDQLNGYENITFGKLINKNTKASCKRKRNEEGDEENDDEDNVGGEENKLPFAWKKISIFFCLPYWKHLNVRHNLDVMHIEKNVCDNILWTLLNVDKKTKDNVKARLDLQALRIRKSLHPQQKDNNKLYLPPAKYSMSAKQKELFFTILKSIKVPDGYSSNISRRVQVKEKKLSGLKSHDCHILMQQLLPLALRVSLDQGVCSVLVQLCGFFRLLCSKVINISDFKELEAQIVLTLCQLERIFPPAFFTLMMHLPVHLAEEARLCGPVQFRWMYPIERYLLTLKNYVRNRRHPEGSIAEAYLANECLNFCSRYLDGVETRINRQPRNIDGTPIGGKLTKIWKSEQLETAKRYVLFNTKIVEPYLRKHKEHIERQESSLMKIESRHHAEFATWFLEHIKQLCEKNEDVSEDLSCLAYGPSHQVTLYDGWCINGWRFHTSDYQQRRTTQNSGVMMSAKTSSFANARDRNPIISSVTYYGVLDQVVELDYGGGALKIVLFKCVWFDESHQLGIQKDRFGFTSINQTRTKHQSDPFILASQAEQCFYVKDPTKPDWHVVVKSQPRDFFDMPNNEAGLENEDINDVIPLSLSFDMTSSMSLLHDDICGVRDDLMGEEVDAPSDDQYA